MTIDPRWNRVGGGGTIQKWTTPGQAIEGTWRGTKPGKFGDLGVIVTPDGEAVTFPMHTVLTSNLGAVKVGAEVHVEYLGRATGKSGTEYKDFFVGVASLEDLASGDDDEDKHA